MAALKPALPLEVVPCQVYLYGMTYSLGKLWPFRWPTKAGAALLAAFTAATAAAASAPAPRSPSFDSSAVLAPVLFKYEELFGRSAGGSKPFSQIDLDRNRALSPAELQSAFGNRWQSVLSSLDRNADGQVTPEEVQSSSDSQGEQSKAPREQRVGAQPDKAPGGRGSSKTTAPDRSSSGKTGSRGGGSDSRGGKSFESRGNGGGSNSAKDGNRGRN